MLAKAVWVWSRLGYHSRSCRRGASIGVLLCGPVTDQIPKDEDTQPSYVDDMELVQRNSMGSSCRGDLTTSPTGWPASAAALHLAKMYCLSILFP